MKKCAVRKIIFSTGLTRAARDGILERNFYSRFLGINSSILRLKFLSGFLPSFFPFYKILFMKGLAFPRIFFQGGFKKSAIRRDCEQHGAKDSSLLVNRCSIIPTQGRTKISASPRNQPRTPFICTQRVPICLSFNSQQGGTSIWSLWTGPYWRTKHCYKRKQNL